VTPAEWELIGLQIAHGMVGQLLANVQKMAADGVPPDRIAACLEWEHDALQHWIEHDFPDQFLKFVQTLEGAAAAPTESTPIRTGL
jgi:hypothetical protein